MSVDLIKGIYDLLGNASCHDDSDVAIYALVFNVELN